MNYYYNKLLKIDFDEAVTKTIEELKKEGFGVLTDIDVKATLKRKLDVDFRKYRILGACNPPYAYEALKIEDKIGLMLPSNVIVQEISEGKVEVAAIDPVVSMQTIKNIHLEGIAQQVQLKLKKIMDNL